MPKTLTTKQKVANKFAQHKKEILDNFDFVEAGRMLLAANYGWVTLLGPEPSLRQVTKRAREIAEELIDTAVSAYHRNEFDFDSVGSGGFKVIIMKDGYLCLEFAPVEYAAGV